MGRLQILERKQFMSPSCSPFNYTLTYVILLTAAQQNLALRAQFHARLADSIFEYCCLLLQLFPSPQTHVGAKTRILCLVKCVHRMLASGSRDVAMTSFPLLRMAEVCLIA